MDIAAKENYITAVKKQCALFEQLKAAMEEEKKILIKNSSDGLEDVIKSKTALIDGIAGGEKLKALCLERMAESLKIRNPSKARLSDVLLAEQGKDSLEIEAAVEALVRLLEKISGTNAGNIRMIKNFLNFAGFSKRLMESITSPKQITYSAGGEKGFGGKDGAKLDLKI
ncbi:MAG: flagellar protein FlgN [Candidatus Goldiibacteriota bacterium]|jgi:flagellar biosynthesis/type III secretory pathway chaperone